MSAGGDGGELESGWNSYRIHVLNEMRRMSDSLEQVEDRLSELRSDLTILKIKAGLWGILGASVPTTAAVLYTLLQN